VPERQGGHPPSIEVPLCSGVPCSLPALGLLHCESHVATVHAVHLAFISSSCAGANTVARYPDRHQRMAKSLAITRDREHTSQQSRDGLKAPEISTPDRHPTANVAPMSPGSTPCLCQSYPQQLRRPRSSAPSRTKQPIGLEPPGRIKNVGYFSRWHVPGWKLPRRWSAAAFACSREAMATHQDRVS
jgi:hypothetical protein